MLKAPCQQGEHSGPFTLHANMQLTSVQQAKSFFGSTYNLLSSSTLLRSLVTWVRNQTRSNGQKRAPCVKASGSSSHLVLLQLQFLHVVELLRLQLAHPVVQLVDLVPAGSTSHAIVGVDSFAPFQKCRPTSACPRSGGRCSGVCVWQPESSSSSLSQSLSYLLSSGQPDVTKTEDMFGN